MQEKVKVSVCASILQVGVLLQTSTLTENIKQTPPPAALQHAQREVMLPGILFLINRFARFGTVHWENDCGELPSAVLQSAFLRRQEFKQSCDLRRKQVKEFRSKACGKETAVTSGWSVYKAVWHRLCKHLGHQAVGSLHSVSEYTGSGMSRSRLSFRASTVKICKLRPRPCGSLADTPWLPGSRYRARVGQLIPEDRESSYYSSGQHVVWTGGHEGAGGLPWKWPSNLFPLG